MNNIFKVIGAAVIIVMMLGCTGNKTGLSNQGLEKMPGKIKWHNMLAYTLKLHEESTHPATYPFEYEWEEIGQGYCYAPAVCPASLKDAN